MSSAANSASKVLVVGDFFSPIHEQALYNAFSSLGCETRRFAWAGYFGNVVYKDLAGERVNPLLGLWYRFQNKFIAGPAIRSLNRDLARQVKRDRPDLVFVYRGTHILPGTIKKMKAAGAAVFGFNNDDPFGVKHPFYLWRHFKRCIPHYDHIFVYRAKNFEDYKRLGYTRTSLLRSYYIKERNYPIESLARRDYLCDVIFVGHYEPDGRDEYVKAIVDAGINFRLLGPEWHRSKYYEYFREKLGEIAFVGDDYNLALNSAKIVLVFLSKLNNDTYTRRCFEIVAAKRFMLSEYTDDLANLFAQGREAAYFTTPADLIEKINYYLAHPAEIDAIREAGYERLLKDGHEVADRAREVLRVFDSYRAS